MPEMAQELGLVEAIVNSPNGTTVLSTPTPMTGRSRADATSESPMSISTAIITFTTRIKSTVRSTWLLTNTCMIR